MPRRHIVRFKQKLTQPAAKSRPTQPFFQFSQENDADRFTNVVLAFRPGKTSIGPNARRKGNAAAIDISGIHFLALKRGNGKQMMKKGNQLKIKSSKATIMSRRKSAQIVMIGMEREQIVPSEVPLASVQGFVSPPE